MCIHITERITKAYKHNTYQSISEYTVLHIFVYIGYNDISIKTLISI